MEEFGKNLRYLFNEFMKDFEEVFDFPETFEVD